MTPDIPSLADLCEIEAASLERSCRFLKRPDYQPGKNILLNEAHIWRCNAERILKYSSDLEKIANEK